MGDWIKGLLPGSLPTDLAKGVALHRAIDGFSETHPAFRRSRARVSGERRRYAGVLVDIYYDHLLARDWSHFHHETLTGYCANIYGLIASRLDDVPESARHALELMAQENWLLSYENMAGIADVLTRMSRRARYPNPLAGAERDLLADPLGFESDFLEWLPDAQRFVDDWLIDSGAG